MEDLKRLLERAKEFDRYLGAANTLIGGGDTTMCVESCSEGLKRSYEEFISALYYYIEPISDWNRQDNVLSFIEKNVENFRFLDSIVAEFTPVPSDINLFLLKQLMEECGWWYPNPFSTHRLKSFCYRCQQSYPNLIQANVLSSPLPQSQKTEQSQVSKYTPLQEFIDATTEQIEYIFEHKHPKEDKRLRWIAEKVDAIVFLDNTDFNLAEINRCFIFDGGKPLKESNRSAKPQQNRAIYPILRSIKE